MESTCSQHAILHLFPTEKAMFQTLILKAVPFPYNTSHPTHLNPLLWSIAFVRSVP